MRVPVSRVLGRLVALCCVGCRGTNPSPTRILQTLLVTIQFAGKLWCGKSYKDLVENCPKECPGATDEECGDGMICFNMAEEEQSCNETGVGIKEPVDSASEFVLFVVVVRLCWIVIVDSVDRHD